MTTQVQSVRQVCSTRGYPYFAYGVYQPTPRRRGGGYYWRLVRSSRRFRSDKRGRLRFDGIPVVPGIRHGQDVGV